MFGNFKKLISIAFFYDKKKFYFVILSSFIIISLELVSIAAFIPLFQILITKNIPSELKFFFEGLNYETILYLSLISILVIFLIKNILLILLEWFIFFYQEIIRTKLSSDLFKFYLSNNWLEAIEKNSTTKIRHIDGEVKNYASYIFTFIKLINETIISFFLIIILAIVNIKILLLNLSILIAFAFFYLFVIRRKFIELNSSRYKTNLSFLSILQDTFRSLKDIKVLQKEKYFQKKFNTINEFYKNIIVKVNTFSILPRYFLEPIIVLILVSIIFILHNSQTENSQMLIMLGIYSVVLFRIFPAASKVITNIQLLTGGTPVIKVVFDDFEKAIKDLTLDKTLKSKDISFQNQIEIRNLNFKYKTKERGNLLKNINLKINKGSSIGVIGPSGSGKSTFVNIILGLIKQDSGKILVDGNEINNLSLEWKKIIGFVPQDINLINGTLLNNIILNFEDDFDEVRMNEAINLSQLKNFVDNLSNGLNTHLGDFGYKISGGQKQRIGIARAIYKRPSIIVLDESTNSLDINLEKEIIQNIMNIKQNYSSIIISHRESTIEKCDHVYRINNGEIEKIK